MNNIILIDKPINYTSRDVVNIASKVFKTKKVGHFGTLDPLAAGLLVLGIGKYTKLGNLFSSDTKEYIVDVLVGTSTDTYDITGNVIEKKNVTLSKEDLVDTLSSFKKTYLQEVPIYSAVKVNGKKLYEYARNGEEVKLPKKEVTIYDIELLECSNTSFRFKTLVSKGTYIRSLINDISKELNVPLTMQGLIRTKQDKFLLDNANTIEELKEGKVNLYDIEDVFSIKKEEIKDEDLKKIINGNKILRDDDLIIFTRNNENFVLYKKIDDKYMKPFLYF